MKDKPILLLLILLLFSCSKDLTESRKGTTENEKILTEEVQPAIENCREGIIRIKTSEELAAALESGHHALLSGSDVSVSRTFPYCGKYEARTRKAGLHLWYDITFNPDLPLTKAFEDLNNIQGVELVAYLPKIMISGSDTGYLPFTDPLLTQQWHYFNDGSLSGSKEGADINVIEAWKYYTTGNPEVIVAVLDGGITVDHDDLAANMWINRAEYDGQTDVDDDNNGYVDDVYGYNFVANSGTITPESHGTHVAGTIGAVNNNGLGLCGVAGGDGIHKGVALMSCQIMDSNDKWGDEAQAIKYAADNGAVICQNSWSYKEYTDATKAYIQAAIDYFVAYAGLDENGLQTGPMAGGLVTFAAGNDNKDTGYPGSYEAVMAVAALKYNYERASYSNYGSWVDISAPGGYGTSEFPAGMILSTVPDNQYGYKNGTSMACPHVSGVAALVVSQFGGPGFTNQMLWNALVNNTRDVSGYNSQYIGMLGSGLIDAYASLASFSKTSPAAVNEIKSSVNANNITLSWQIPRDEDDGKAYGFTVFCRHRDNPDSYVTASALTGRLLEEGDIIYLVIKQLDFATDYSISILAYDYARNPSEISPAIEVTTDRNRAPVVTPIEGSSITLKAHQTGTLTFKVTDPDWDTASCTLIPGSAAASLTMKNDTTAMVTISAAQADPGIYSGSLVATDSYGLSSAQEFDYIILKNNPPQVISTIDNICIGRIGGTLRYIVGDYFSDPDEEPLHYTFSASSSNASATLEDDILYITGSSYGYCTLTVKATDMKGESCELSFQILTRDNSREIDVYPNPVTDILNLRTGSPARKTVILYSSSGAKVFEDELDMSPFTPGKVNMTAVAGGVYTLIIKDNNKEIKQNIVKL